MTSNTEREELPNNEKMVFAIGPCSDNIPLLIVGVPLSAWKYIRNGRTCHFDLQKGGVPLRVMVFGGANQFMCMRALDAAMTERGMAYLDNRREDMSIKDLVDVPEISAIDPAKMTREQLEAQVVVLRRALVSERLAAENAVANTADDFAEGQQE